MLDLEKIIENCGVNSLPTQEVIKKLANLEEFYDVSDIVNIYNYILTHIKNTDILIQTVKLAEYYKADSTLSILIDILLSKIIDYDNSDEIIDLRVTCAKSISNYRNNSTVKALLHCLNNKNENYKIRLACADALGRIGDRFAVTPLINVVKDEEEKSIYLKESAAFALGLIGDYSAIDPLISIMDAKQGISDKFTFLKEKIIEVLAKFNIHNSKILNVYKNSLMDSSSIVRINTIEALMNSDFEEAPQLIKTALHDEDEEVQKNALIALYNIIGRDILDEVISLPGYSKTLKNEAQNIILEYENEEE